MIKIICDICQKEPDDKDFVFEATKSEIVTSFGGADMTPQQRMHKEMIQICKGCFYKHISKLLKHD
jgi:dihydroorotase